MIQAISTVEDVQEFFRELHEEQLCFHPDDDFADYISFDTGIPLYSTDEAQRRNELLYLAFKVCETEGADIYDLCMEIFHSDFHKAIPTK